MPAELCNATNHQQATYVFTFFLHGVDKISAVSGNE